MSQAEVPVPAAYMPVSERPTSSQSNSTPSRANIAASPQANAATPQSVVSNGIVTAPKPTQSLNRTTAPQFPAVPASSAGTIPVETYDNWRVGLCDVDDLETCVRLPNVRDQFSLLTFPRSPPGASPAVSRVESTSASRTSQEKIPASTTNATRRVASPSCFTVSTWGAFRFTWTAT